jgi:hypothetical protein
MLKAQLLHIVLIAGLAVVAVSAPPAFAQVDRQPLHPTGRIATESTVRTWVSGCLEGSVQSEENRDAAECTGIILSTSSSSVRMQHLRATMNCCTDVAVTATMDGSTVRFEEQESGQWCHCLCPYDLEAELAGVRAGTYTAEVWSSADELLCRHEIHVGPQPITASSSGCLARDGAERDTATFTVIGNDLQIQHHATELSCCLELAVSTQVNDRTLRVLEHDQGAPCDCLCPFDLVLTVHDLAPGSWDVELLDPNGSQVASATVTVP